jgi:sugar transferase (PEP-CTERM/EpsH1 system associated)
MTTVSDFQGRVRSPDVRFIGLGKPPGHAVPLYPRILRLLRELRPDVAHTCNLAGLELAPLAWLAGVPLRVHAEHGWDVHDLDGSSTRYRRVRRLYRPFVSHYVAVSRDLHDYLGRAVGVPSARRSLVTNGVDTQRFRPRPRGAAAPAGFPFEPGRHWIVGTVGRMQAVKNQPLLARAFVRLLAEHPEAADRARLVMLGDGPLMAEVRAVLEAAGQLHRAWLPGARDDVAALMPLLDCFVLPSHAEGTSCTLQEAMACGLPAVATAVGGTPDLVAAGRTGWLVPPADEAALAEALGQAWADPVRAAAMGAAARAEAERRFALPVMVRTYARLFGLADPVAKTSEPATEQRAAS